MKVILATEYPKSFADLRKMTDVDIYALHQRMVELNQEIGKNPSVVLMDNNEIANIVIMSQYWGRQAYEELVKRNVPVVRYFNWTNDGSLFTIIQGR